MDGYVVGLILIAVALALCVYVFVKRPSRPGTAQRLLRFLFVAALLVAACVLLVLEFGPNGRNSLLSEAGRGENEGSDTRQTVEEQLSGGEGKDISCVVSGTVINIGGMSFDCAEGSYTEFDRYIADTDFDGYEVRLVDNYAVSAVYHHAAEFMQLCGIEFEEVSEK